ncbi:DNA translocase FtsK [Psychrobacillus sp.]|uniref:DNA translocase FtsK n=1 Tax=Psychrobacillus sp. TaxID=1871623 RepID=UPI0037CAEA5E
MNWFKKLFMNNDDEYIEEYEVKEEKQQPFASSARSKTPFRFPLISDEEKQQQQLYGHQTANKEVEEPYFQQKIEEEQFVKPLYTQERWAQREVKPVVHRAAKKEVEEAPPIVNKRKKAFTPTNVPSPVYGFARDKKEEELVETEIAIEEPIIPIAEEPIIPIVEESNVVEFIEKVEETPLVVEEIKPVEIAPPVVEARKESIRPFNVLMLKSDKEKVNKIEVKPVLVEPVKMPVQEVSVPKEELPQTDEMEQVSNYAKPSFSYLLPPEMKNEDKEWMEEQAFKLIEALSHFQVAGEMVQMVQGPAVTQFEITVGNGTKVSKIRNLADDLKLALAAKDIRIQAPIPGKSSIGIEIPNRKSRAVRLSEVIHTNVFLESDSPLEVALGLDLTGKPVTLDLRKMPHGLIAGATGSGKSVFINSLLISLLYKATPEEVKLLLIDPKMVELAPFNHIPHLVSPVITDVKAATAALKWAVEEMERRYQLFAHIGVRDISRYNTLATEKRQFAQKLPYIVIVIDELADLMMMAPAEVEDAICRIAQKARACGIHLALATQRPSVDVITGLIKANIPTRIAFSVSSQIDSRTILDQQGAERLLGKGDMLYQGNGMSSPVRIQGTFVTDEEIEQVIEYARSQGTPKYLFEQEELLKKAENIAEQDELFEEACRFIVEQGSASTSLLQRKFHLGYNRAARLIDAMYENGYITEQKGSKARDVLLSDDSLEEIFS